MRKHFASNCKERADNDANATIAAASEEQPSGEIRSRAERRSGVNPSRMQRLTAHKGLEPLGTPSSCSEDWGTIPA